MKYRIPFCFLLFLSTTLVWSKIHSVPQEYLTIQSAINAAQHLDTILVSEGRYFENISFNGKGIVVTSRFFITNDWKTVHNTVIDGSTGTNKDTASVVQFLHEEDSTAVIDGFTITGGSGTKYFFGSYWQEGAGIILHRSSAVVRNNIIHHNTTKPVGATRDGGGGGIASMYGNPTIDNNVIHSNSSGYAGGIVLNWSNGKIRNNIIYHNSSVSLGTGGVMLWKTPAGSTILENNTIVGNVSNSNAGGINNTIDNPSIIPIVRNNIVWGNRQVSGGQVVNPQNTLYNNIEDYSGGTNISLNPQLQDSTFEISDASPCIDAGDSSLSCNDKEDGGVSGKALSPSKGTVRNDIGAFGGFHGKKLTAITISDLHSSKKTLVILSPPNQQAASGFELFNKSSHRVIIDSLTHSNSAQFGISKKISGQMLGLFASDSVVLVFGHSVRGKYYDTLKLFHQSSGIDNPLIFPVTGISNTPPFIYKPVPMQYGHTGQLFTFHLPDSTFLDNDKGDSLTFQASGLPGWLTFDPVTRTLQGIPLEATVFPFGVRITANDSLLASAVTTIFISVEATAGLDDQTVSLFEFRLCNNYPNPFNPSTVIRFTLQVSSHVSLNVYNILGQEEAQVVDEYLEAGVIHQRTFDGSGLSGGLYFAKLSSGSRSQIKKMLLLK